MSADRAARRSLCAVGIVLAAAASTAAQAGAAEAASNRQSLDDAWWTGPILAASAGTLPKGHALIEPYVFDVIGQGRYDDDGDRRGGERTHSLNSFTYMLYGLTDRITVGAIPRFAFNDVRQGADSSGIRVGDFTLQAQYRFTQYREDSRIPTISFVVAETLPTGRHDRLGSRPSDGVGAGAYTTTLSLYSQYFLWMPNGRIVRTRLNVSYGFSGDVSVQDVSVYGTNSGFRGHARPGASLVAISAWEYSLTRNWVLALDVQYQHDASTNVDGYEFPSEGSGGPPVRVEVATGSRETLSLAPAIEYNWNSRMGIIVGTVFTAAGRNASATVIPVAAVNMVF